MINVIFNDFNFEIAPKRLETYDKYCKILKWGRQNPTRFMETFMKLEFTDYQKYCFLGGWNASTVVYLMSRSSGKLLRLKDSIYKVRTQNFKENEIEKIQIKDLKVGDYILGGDGKPTQVIQLHPIIIDDEYELKMRDGRTIICGPEHLWGVYDLSSTNKFKIKVLETQFLKSNLYQKNGECRYALPINYDYGEKNKILKEEEIKYNKIVDIRKTGKRSAMRCITVDNKDGLFLVGDDYTITHNSYLIAPIMMARAILLPNTNTYIMAPKGPQAQETFSKMENLAKGNIASALGVTTFFLDECVRQTAKADPFTHNPNSYTVKLFNGSTINTLNSVAKQIVGIRLIMVVLKF